ncbi:uncharacterized protein LOC131955549 [Physella acuta]|uniref:uncharacterized protein LOC131955549 n=1 Tax=Physella acuta TaxID=109671 RepID=UPI0027DCA12B|nr:uncharacterized protein LOC131955549 [Physella acuta]
MECKVIESQKGKQMLVVDGFVLTKNRQRGDLFYWECSQRQHLAARETADTLCKARASTIFLNGSHTLRKCSAHNHAPQASDVVVREKLTQLKTIAAISQELPTQMVEASTSDMSMVTRVDMPSKQALTKRIKRTQNKNHPVEPHTLEDVAIPDDLRLTQSGALFLLKESSINNDKLLIFSTESNIQKLGEAMYWIMDGTFKTAPNIFLQIYSIHAPVGYENCRVLPLVYILMSRKTEAMYTRAFQDLADIAEKMHIHLSPRFIVTDFEKAAINACIEFPTATSKGCFFHFSQNIWRKLQALGLALLYGQDPQFCLLMRQIAALAFLPSAEIPEAFNELKNIFPPNTAELVKWFDETYVCGRVRLLNAREVRVPPLFPPEFWSVHDNHVHGIPRTQNTVEGWHRRWQVIVGKDHPGVFCLLNKLKQEQGRVEVEIEAWRASKKAKKTIFTERGQDNNCNCRKGKQNYT